CGRDVYGSGLDYW
nr:immunoglobulin heavy chain junction region [Macaca mulatta]